jgi:phospholipase C
VIEGAVTRRTLLRHGATATGALLASGALPATGALPAWANPIARSAGVRRPDSLPFPHLPAGHASMPHIQHIVVLMMENHSFDNLLGMVPHQVHGRAKVDGLTVKHGRPQNYNRDATGAKVFATHASSPCQEQGKPIQPWDASHESYDSGRNDGFVRASGPVAMWYWDKSDIPFTYSLAQHFPIGERYFSSTLCQTYPNRRYLFTGTSSGLIATNLKATLTTPAANGTIFDRLDAHQVDWQVYYATGSQPSPLIVPSFTVAPGRSARLHTFDVFLAAAAAGRLPAFSFLDPNYGTTSQEDPQDIQVGEQYIAQVVHALTTSPNWKNTALFITYDEGGGYYDHVPPPKAIRPDSIAPVLPPYDQYPGAFDRYGFRVPLIVVSPWAKRNYVSRVVQDHTSITAFIERKWNLPAMTFRDANAAPMTDYFDFGRKPSFLTPPRLAHAPGLAAGLRRCTADGLTPPLSS